MRHALPIALGLVLLLSGCPHFEPAGRYGCSEASDCPPGETCDENGQCIGRPDWAACSSSGDCPGGYDCLQEWATGANVCQRVCKSDEDCLNGFRCESGHCVPNYCSPYGKKSYDKLPVQTVNYFLGPCDAFKGGTGDGTCVGPLAPGSHLLQDSSDYVGLCYPGGSVDPGGACLENVVNQDTKHNCIAGAFCGASIPGYHVAKCQRLCGPRKPSCFSPNEGCWLVWGSNGICVPQADPNWSGRQVGEACTQLYPGGGAESVACAGAAVCATDSDGGSTCEPTCMSDYDCNQGSDGGTDAGTGGRTVFCEGVPGGPPGASYCAY